MSLWEAINDVLFSIASGFGKGVASEFVPLSQIGAELVRNGMLKDYGSGTATKRQLSVVLSEVKKHGGECEIKIKGDTVYIKATFNQGNSRLNELR